MDRLITVSLPRLMALIAALALALPAPALASPKHPTATAAKKATGGKARKHRRTKKDLDGNGIPNRRDKDVDGDGVPNKRDKDVDGDGVPNKKDKDVDGDGVPNKRDRDMDRDGVPNKKDKDMDGDGVANHKDKDMDGDGVPNKKDKQPSGSGRYGVGQGAFPTVGISDQRASTFTDPLFAALGLKVARYITPWNAIYTEPAKLDAWLQGAAAQGIEPLVAFNHSEGDKCPAAPCNAPSVADYTAAFRAFRARYPWVTTISPWNEANHASQPVGKNPRRAAEYYNAVYDNCAGCRIVAADLLDSPNLANYLTAFKAVAKGNPRLWGLHNYSDANRFRTTGTDTLLSLTQGEVWLTETGGVVDFTTTAGVVALPYDEARAAKAMNYLFDTLVKPNSKRITRVYLYQWKKTNADDRFDAGMVSFGGVPRESYRVVQRKLGL